MRLVISVLFALILISLPLTALAKNAGADMHNKAGIKHWGMGHADEALKHFKEAGAEDSSIAEIHFNEAIALDALGDHGAATKHFQKAKDLAKGDKNILSSPILNGHLGH